MKRINKRIRFLMISGLVAITSPTFGQMLLNNYLEVGVRIVDISGEDAVILDPIYVSADVLRQGVKQIAQAEYDVTSVSGEMTTGARMEAAWTTGILYNNICVAAIHTHMASYVKELKSAVIKAIGGAQANLQKVRFKSAIGIQFNVSHNRRYFMRDGSVGFNPMFLNSEIVKSAGPIDSEIGIVLFTDALAGNPVSGLLNSTLHLIIVKEYGAVYQQSCPGSRNSVSSDYPYLIAAVLKMDFGPTINSVFFTGCCGNINHWDFSKPGPQSGHKTKSKEVGDSLYSSIKSALPEAGEEAPALVARTRVINVPLQSFSETDMAWAKGVKASALSGKSKESSERQQFLDNVKRRRILWLDEQKQMGITTIPLDVQIYRLSDITVVATLPGEMFVGHGLAIKNFSPFENTIVVELANNSIACAPNRRALVKGGYEVENSRLAHGGGDMLAGAAIEMLKELKQNAR